MNISNGEIAKDHPSQILKLKGFVKVLFKLNNFAKLSDNVVFMC